ncbi:MAG TPA: leucine-rich repeat domain-containing protein [Atribacterota bacterium]|nr:leucine-rich repeat domain-containing protein [Atribacterota bacterium]
MYNQKIRKLTIVLFLLTVFLLGGCNQLPGGSCVNEVQFVDKNLEQVVRVKINKLSGPLYQSDVVNIFELDAEKKGIVSLSGIEHLKNLRELDLDDNQISDLSPLAGLTKLKELDLENNNISDLSSLTNLINLEELDFENNKVTDISALVSNKGISMGDEVDMRYNHLDLSEGSKNMQDINTLINRGVKVEYIPQSNH